MTSPDGPQLPLGLNDLRGLQQLVEIYLAYLRKEVPRSTTPVATIQILLEIRQRLVSAQHSGRDPVRIPLTLPEWQALHDAIAGVHWLFRQRIPPSAERDGLLAILERLRKKVAQIITSLG